MSFYGCQIKELKVFDDFMRRSPNLKVIWLNDNPICNDKEQENIMRSYIEQEFPNVELFNSKFTKHCGTWGLKFVSFGFDINLADTTPDSDLKHLDISSRDIYRIENCTEKIQNFSNLTKITANDTFFESVEQAAFFIEMMKKLPKLESLYLDYYMLDLFWKIKKRILGLFPQFKNINGYDIKFTQPSEEDLKIERVVGNLWRNCQWFSYQIPEDSMTYYSMNENDLVPEIQSTRSKIVFYLNDELGSYINSDLNGNVKMIPLLKFTNNKNDKTPSSFSLLLIIKDIKQGEELSQGIVQKEKVPIEEILRNKLIFGEHCINQKPDYLPQIMENYVKFLEKLTQTKSLRQQEHFKDTIIKIKSENQIISKKFEENTKIKIFTDYPYFKLTPSNYEMVSDPLKADFIYSKLALGNLAKSSEDLAALKQIHNNSFTNEFRYVRKDFLNQHVQDFWGTTSWWPLSFDLSSQLQELSGEFLYRKYYSNEDNLWLIKPSNLAHSENMILSDSLNLLLKNAETIQNMNENSLASKYIHSPLKYENYKFDTRWVVVVRSFDPLEVYLFCPFWVRISKNDFTTDKRRLFQHDTHFTLNTHLDDNQKGLDITYEEFCKNMSKKHPEFTHEIMKNKIKELSEELFYGLGKSFEGLRKDSKGSGVYGIDVMFDSDYNAKLLEVTVSPDCERAQRDHPTFWNQILDLICFGKQSKNFEKIF